jgi:aldehyde:ferredoxin oxidoreductase
MIGEDPLKKILHIDLSIRRFWVEERKELFEKFIGGAGVASQLLKEECVKKTDPLGPGNPIIFAVGPLTGVFPLASKTVSMFKSPLTGNLGESHAGGRSAIAIRMAGYGAIVIKGQSSEPVYVAVHGNKVYFRSASVLWGMGNSYSVGRILRERESGAGLRTIMRIGRAGEELISYASLITETYRHFGRLGLGAVFGSKKLKAIVISGHSSLKVNDVKQYRKTYDEIYNSVVNSPAMNKYHELGTPMNVNVLNQIEALPTKNLKEAKFENADNISGETFLEKYLGRRIACSHCPVSCIHLAALRESYTSDPYFFKTTMISYDYEPIFSLGSMLGIADPDGLLRLLEEVEILGFDAMSAGVVLAWATESQESGLITEKETLGINFKWGNYEDYIKALRLVIKCGNEFYEALARGVEHASTIYGGNDFALAFGGNEMPGYHTGPATYIGFLTGARHSHLDNAGYSLDQKALSSNKKLTPEETANKLLSEEIWRQVLSSLVVCFFARGIYAPEILTKALEIMGYNLTNDDLLNIGREILKIKNKFKRENGFDENNLRIPKRIFETKAPTGEFTEEYIRKGVFAYFKLLDSN